MDRWPAAANPAAVGRAPSLLPAAMGWRSWGARSSVTSSQNAGRRRSTATLYGFSYTKVFIWAATVATLLVGAAVLLGTQMHHLKSSNQNANLMSIDSGTTGTLSNSGNYVTTTVGAQPPSAAPAATPTPSTPVLTSRGSLVGDPHFVGFDGTGFDFHGWNDGVFNILSDPNHQLNALLHSFGVEKATFVKELGFKYRPANVQVKIAAVGPGKLAVEVNDKAVVSIYGHISVKLSDSVSLVYQARADDSQPETVTVTTEDYIVAVYIEPKELHLNLQISVVDARPSLNVHGVMGQTYAWALSEDVVDTKHLNEGQHDIDFQVSTLFSDDFLFNLYGVDVQQ